MRAHSFFRDLLRPRCVRARALRSLSVHLAKIGYLALSTKFPLIAFTFRPKIDGMVKKSMTMLKEKNLVDEVSLSLLNFHVTFIRAFFCYGSLNMLFVGLKLSYSRS